MSVHVFDAARQSATRWVDHIGDRRFIHRNPGNRLLATTCCYRNRPAKNLDVKSFYDGVYIFCRKDTGCKVPRRRMKAARILAREFKAGLSMIGLARKYGMTNKQVQAQIRKAFR